MSETIAGYRILNELGRGAEGVVYLAESPGVGKTVALKVFAPAQQGRFERALETYRALERVRQGSGGVRHLAEGLAAGPLPEGGGFLATAYQASGSLADRVQQEGALPAPVAAQLTLEVLEGLSALHAAGLCHRDVKPQNVLVNAAGQAVLGDFGLVSEREATISTGGTPAFAAPEQWSVDHSGEVAPESSERRSGIAIDIYGVGATCYYLLTGRSPVPGAPDLFLLESRQVPRPLQAVLLRALAPRASDRHANVEELSRDLESALAPPPPPTRAGSGGVLLVSLLAVGAAALWASSGVLGTPRADATPASPTPTPSAAGPPSPLPRDPAKRPPSTPKPSPLPPSPSPSSPAATPRPEASPTQTRVPAKVDRTRHEITLERGSTRTLLARYAGPPLLVVELSDGRFACSGVAEVGRPPVLDLVAATGERARRLQLEAFPEFLVPIPSGGLAFATSEGVVLIFDPQRDSAPRELTRFEHAVLGLELRGERLWARGDVRQARPLGTGETPAPGEELISGVLGRYAFPLQPRVEERWLDLE